MVGIAQPAGVRAASFGCGLVVLVITLFSAGSISPAPASGEAPTARSDRTLIENRAGISIVNGRRAKINDWPWQVALLTGKSPGRTTPRSRQFCGGSLIAPDLVLTAGHCLVGQKRKAIRAIKVVSGRTHINRVSGGITSSVKRAILPVNEKGKRRFRDPGGTPDWDVALLQLTAPVASKTIKIAGPDERKASRPGSPVFSTGWGVTSSRNRKGAASLMMAKQVILPDRLCRSTTGRFFRPARMNCLGGPGAHSSTCFGDSGGPLVAAVGDEFRLVGLTSGGDPYCTPYIPSVDARVADGPLRGWIQQTAMKVSGVDVIGRGGEIEPAPEWCRVPNLQGKTISQAKKVLRSRGCRLGNRRPDRFAGLRRGRISFSTILPGWLAPPKARIEVWVAR